MDGWMKGQMSCYGGKHRGEVKGGTAEGSGVMKEREIHAIVCALCFRVACARRDRDRNRMNRESNHPSLQHPVTLSGSPSHSRVRR